MGFLARLIINVVLPSHLIPGKLRVKFYNLFKFNIKAKEVRAKCFFNSKNITIGEGCFVNFYTQFHCSKNKNGKIEIGENCFLGMNVNLCTISHELGNSDKRAGKELYAPIKIEDGVWIGANSTVLPGVTIGQGCVIAAGSVVTKDCEPNTLYGGVPAEAIKTLQ